jgi:uncharacterized integral membrane protein (TIGR00698 family)
VNTSRVRLLLPGLALSAGIGVIGKLLEAGEQATLGRAYVEGLVLAIIIGLVVASAWEIPEQFAPGIDFSAKMLLEIAVCLIGVAIDTQLLRKVGVSLFAGILGIVVLSLAVTFGVGKLLGLRSRLAFLLATGNSICGNSAIAAVAPVIGADADDIAAAISFTAVLSVVVVLTLPLLVPAYHLSDTQYGVVAGLTVYAVPQVLAATLPVGAAASAMATLVKLVRVILLGPLVIGAGMVTHKSASSSGRRLVPWFIYGFIVFAALRSFGVLNDQAISLIRTVSGWLTILAMAALGLGVDVRRLKRSSGRVIAVVCISLAVLMVTSLILARRTVL